jgi:hypothetical protein
MLARPGETWVITHRDYQDAIERALPSVPEREGLRFVYVELPVRKVAQPDEQNLPYTAWTLARQCPLPALVSARRAWS